MVKICPISERNVNEKVTRLNASFTFVLALLFFMTGSFWILIAILTDFSFRLISEGKLSPVIRFNSYLLDNLKVRKNIINAGPKIFAARIGLTLAVVSIAFWFSGLILASQITLGILGFFSFLEFAFGLCVACKIYPYALILNEIGISKKG